ncbi:hypothetical protein PYW08_010497 [Mythimna loreyi]|uniref:Uncharacterized protein n=1 Tax=Mythimna loreyi TaxID=667449 RepID=A0ACC2Q6J7_9NEOP|nr:hypothetical protein PYW08_010497 [Mythimna loreyi]
MELIPNIHCACENEPKARFECKNSPIDAGSYDYHSKRTFLTRPNNLMESVIHMLMCGLGGGLVAVHAAYMECGLFIAMAMNVLLSALVGYCACILVWSAQHLYGRVEMHELTYPDVMEAAVLLSPWPTFRNTARGLRYLVEVTLICHLYGSCCVVIIIIARNLKELGTGDGAISDGGNPSLKVIILCLMVPCAVICMITDLKNLAPFALVCDLFGVVLILALLWYSLHDIQDSPLDRSPYKSVMGLVQFTCICVFVLEPLCYALPIENNMKEPKKFHYVVLAAMPIITVAMLTVGFLGYWYYGEYSVAPITVHFPFSSFAVTLKIFLCLSLYMVFTLCFYLGFDLQWYYLRRNHALSNYWFFERVYRIIHVVALTLIAYSVPNVTRMMGILGAIT